MPMTCRAMTLLLLLWPVPAALAQNPHSDAIAASSIGDVLEVTPAFGTVRLDDQTPAPAPRPGTAAPPQPTTPPAARAPKVKSFSVVLLAGEVQGREVPSGGPSGEIPPAVQKALASVQAFLPYKTYRLYDAALLPAPIGFNETSSALMRSPVNAQRTRVELHNARLATPPPTSKAMVMTISLSEFWAENSGIKPSEDPRRSTIMSANVSIDVGETVVVGTSQLGGSTGLIALLTAIPE